MANHNENVKNEHILHSSVFNSTLRSWHSMKHEISANNLMYPVFIVEDDDAIQSIPSMPGVSRYGINKLKTHLEELVKKGLTSILIFGVAESLKKDEVASNADSDANPVIRALPKLKNWFPELTLVCDVCLCPYSSHGHCGILKPDGFIDNDKSIARIAEIALSYALKGADIVAPSDMMDGRIGAIKNALRANGRQNSIAVLSYTAKFASSFYGPFRDAANSKPTFGDRKRYQLPPASGGLAVRAARRDVAEGADMLMVKPIMAYMDILKELKDSFPEYPMFVYQVSGEYSMLINAAKSGVIDLKTTLNEILISFKRAGADVIITYFTPQILDWLSLKSKF